MGDVHAVVLAYHFRQRYQLFGLGIKSRRIDQRRAEAQGAIFHRLPDQFLHPFQFARSGRAILITDFVLAHGGRANKRGNIG